MARAVDAAFVIFVLAIGERIGSAILGTDVYAFAVLDVEGGAGGVGQGQTVQSDCTLVFAILAELSIVRRTTKVVGNLHRRCSRCDDDMRGST